MRFWFLINNGFVISLNWVELDQPDFTYDKKLPFVWAPTKIAPFVHSFQFFHSCGTRFDTTTLIFEVSFSLTECYDMLWPISVILSLEIPRQDFRLIVLHPSSYYMSIPQTNPNGMISLNSDFQCLKNDFMLVWNWDLNLLWYLWTVIYLN
jgi:hypothetical protein